MMVFNVLVAFVLGFVLGRIYQIRRDELERRHDLALPPTARIPRPTGAEVSGQTSASAAPCRSAIDNRLDRSGTADLFVRSTAATASRRTKAPTSVTPCGLRPDALARSAMPQMLKLREGTPATSLALLSGQAADALHPVFEAPAVSVSVRARLSSAGRRPSRRLSLAGARCFQSIRWRPCGLLHAALPVI